MDPRLKRLYWQLTALLLAAHFAGWAHGLPLAMGLTAWQAVHFAAHRRTLRALDLQVRLGYLGLLLLGTVGPLWPIHLVQFAGVNALLVVDYCLLARLLVLMPWNRAEPFSAGLLQRALLLPPAPGAIHRLLGMRVVRGLGPRRLSSVEPGRWAQRQRPAVAARTDGMADDVPCRPAHEGLSAPTNAGRKRWPTIGPRV